MDGVQVDEDNASIFSELTGQSSPGEQLHAEVQEDYDDEEDNSWFRCPFCYEEYMFVAMIDHIDLRHPYQVFRMICPFCPLLVQREYGEHILLKHDQEIEIDDGTIQTETDSPIAAGISIENLPLRQIFKVVRRPYPPSDPQDYEPEDFNPELNPGKSPAAHDAARKEEGGDLLLQIDDNDDDLQEEKYCCPYCIEYFDPFVFYYHIHDEHCNVWKECPICHVSIVKIEMAYHIVTEHQSLVQMANGNWSNYQKLSFPQDHKSSRPHIETSYAVTSQEIEKRHPDLNVLHIFRTSGNWAYTCPFCNRDYDNFVFYHHIYMEHSDEAYVGECLICGARIAKNSMADHIELQHRGLCPSVWIRLMIASQESHLESLHIGRSGCPITSTPLDSFLSPTTSTGNHLLLDTEGLVPEEFNEVGESPADHDCEPAKEGPDQAFQYDNDFHEDTYTCPVCNHHFDLFLFYIHIDSEHLLENCPICLIDIQGDISQHILEQHGHIVTVKGRRNFSEDSSKACRMFQGGYSQSLYYGIRYCYLASANPDQFSLSIEAPEHGQSPLDAQVLHLRCLNENVGVSCADIRYHHKEEAAVRTFHDDDDFQDERYFCPTCNQGFDLFVFFFHIYDEHLKEDCPICAATIENDIAEHLLEHESLLTSRNMKRQKLPSETRDAT